MRSQQAGQPAFSYKHNLQQYYFKDTRHEPCEPDKAGQPGLLTSYKHRPKCFITLFDLPQNTNNDKTRQLHKSK